MIIKNFKELKKVMENKFSTIECEVQLKITNGTETLVNNTKTLWSSETEINKQYLEIIEMFVNLLVSKEGELEIILINKSILVHIELPNPNQIEVKNGGENE